LRDIIKKRSPGRDFAENGLKNEKSRAVARDYPQTLREKSARAVVDVAAAVTVAVVALTRLFGNIADHGAGYAADGSADSGTAYVAGNCTAENRAAGCAHGCTLFSLRAACHRQTSQQKYDRLFH
jgi:hypothetical protein